MIRHGYKTLSFLALAFAVPAVTQAEPCPQAAKLAALESVDAPSGASALDAELANRIDTARTSAGLGALETHAMLSKIAAAHASDMAERGYAADTNPEGHSLLDQVRKTDRQSLYSAFGTNIAIASAGADAGQLHNAMMRVEENAANIQRSSFNHVGIGSAERDGQIYVVQLFARIEGELDQPLPVQSGSATALRTSLSGASMVPVSWSVSAPDGALLLRGSGDRLRDGRGKPVEGYLNLDVAVGQDVYTLRGPFVRMN